MKRVATLLRENSLIQNSCYPMISTAIMAGLGFLFWTLVAHLFTETEVGLAATLISVMSTVSVLSLFGFDTATIRFLSHEKNKNTSINTSILILTFGALTLSSLFVLFVTYITPSLAPFFTGTTLPFLFILFTVLSTINGYTDAVFLSYRRTKYTLIINTVFSVTKVAFPFFFIGYGVFGIFASAALAQAVGFILSFITLIRYFNFKPKLTVNTALIKKVWRYSASNYTADIFTFLPTALLPIIITNNLGAESTAYYYMVMMIMGLLYVIPTSTMRALFAEGAHNKNSINANICTALKTTFFFLIPAILTLVLFGKYLLILFGTQYVENGTTLLYIMTFSSILVTISTLYSSLFRLSGDIRSLIIRNVVFTMSLLGLTYVFLNQGVTGVGWAYVSAYTLSILTCMMLYKKDTILCSKK